MNIRWLKQNLGMVLFGIVFVVVLAGLVWQLRAAMAEQQTVIAELQGQEQSLQSLESQRPYPSSQNIQRIKTDLEKLQQINSQLQDSLAVKNIQAPAPRSESEFAQLLGNSIQGLSSNAALAELQVPANYSFGFSRYIAAWPCRDPAVNKADCLALLGKQMVVIERLTSLLITNGIRQLEYIHRAEVEPGTSEDTLSETAVSSSPLYSILPLELKLSCGPEALQNFVNSLTSLEWMVAIRNLKIEVSGTGIPAAQMTEENAQDRHISVVLRLDVIEFPQLRARAPKEARH